MKEFKCHKCGCYLGEMEKGKLKKGSCLLCTECYESYKTFESLCNLKHGNNKVEMPEFFNDIFGKNFDGKK